MPITYVASLFYSIQIVECLVKEPSVSHSVSECEWLMSVEGTEPETWVGSVT